MKIAFVIMNHRKWHEGAVRPFLNFTKGLKEKNKILLVLFKCGNELIDYANENLTVPVIPTHDYDVLVNSLVRFAPQFIVGDDDLKRLRLLSEVKKSLRRIKAVAYFQILYGIHSITKMFNLNSVSLKEKILYKASRLVPFTLLTRGYNSQLENLDLIIANSRLTANLLQILYGKKSDGVIYPPVDTEVFKQINCKRSRDVVLYLGSNAGDTSGSFTEMIVKKLLQLNCRGNLIGNTVLAYNLQSKYPSMVFQENRSDIDLAKLYSKSIVTICPQKWELFGYVQVESMACGTPVLSFDYMGPSETIIHRKTGWLAKNKLEFLNRLASIMGNKESEVDRDFMRKYVEGNFSIEASARKLEEVLME